MTDSKVTKGLFTSYYYIKLSSYENEFEILQKYMKDKGWHENEGKRNGGLHVFEKEGKDKRILNTSIKTVFIDGRLNF